MSYEVVIKPSAKKELKELPKPFIAKVTEAIVGLANDPRPHGCKKIVNAKENLWRIRVSDYRVIYLIEDTIKIIEIRKVGHRKEVYE
jgi:mRNA interferase RelE/StbE